MTLPTPTARNTRNLSTVFAIVALGWVGTVPAAEPASSWIDHPPATDQECVRCHDIPGGRQAAAVDQMALPPEADLAHWWFGCSAPCHSLHGGGDNLFLIPGVINTPNSGPKPVVFERQEGPNSYADGDSTFDGVCEVCHTVTSYHHNDVTGDHTHWAAQNCSVCHDHGNYFQATDPENHPQSTSDCSNCHLDPETGEPDLIGVHDRDCAACHTVNLSSTLLGPIGTWQGECSECHNPGVPETGSVLSPTNGHRCTLCHGEQRSTADPQDIHDRHVTEANCVVCHGFIPDMNVAIGSGNRDVCALCHNPGQHNNTTQRAFHNRHVPNGLDCLECHNGERPAVDTVEAAPIGGSSNVCEICHNNRSPDDFQGQMERRHKSHADQGLGCGTCHADATLQDDRMPMPAIDDAVRSSLDRQGNNECSHCHEGGESGSSLDVHDKHVADQWQWCFNCHEPSDLRPSGQQSPVTAPADSCLMCHDDQTYTAPFPFTVHRQHADKNKCYSCHQLDPTLEDWPRGWRQPALSLMAWYEDLDADIHGNPAVTHRSVVSPVRFVARPGDCNDSEPETFTGATQECDGLNNDCAHPMWPGIEQTNEFDDDGDSYSECQGDCDDSDPATYAQALEINDGHDNQCPGDPGHGVIDELSGDSVFSKRGGLIQLRWAEQPAASSYEIIRSPVADFSLDCVFFSTTVGLLVENEIPSSGVVFNYLVRPSMPNSGSWGADSEGRERDPVCFQSSR